MNKSVTVALLAFLLALDLHAAVKRTPIAIEETKLPTPLQGVLETQYELGTQKLGSGGIALIQVFESAASTNASPAELLESLMGSASPVGIGLLKELCPKKQACGSFLIRNHAKDQLLSTLVHYLSVSSRKSGFENYQYGTLLLQNFLLDTVGRDYIEISSKKETDAKDLLTSVLIRRDGTKVIVLNYEILNPAAK